MDLETQSPLVPILLVDDRPENLTALEGLLGDQGYDLVRAFSGNEALRLTLKQDFALILLDVQMPDMDGFETAELLRTNPRTRQIPIIFVTAGMKDLHYYFKGYDAGAVDYLTKPIEPLFLQSKVSVFAELYRQRRTVELSEQQLEAMVRDRTAELNKTLSRLLESEAKLNEAQRLAHIGSWDWNAKTDTLYWSPEYYHIYNLDPKAPTPNYEEHLKVYTPASIAKLDAAVKRTMQTGEPYELDLELAHPDAKRRWVVARGEALRAADGGIIGLRGTAQNITERKIAEETTRRSLREKEVMLKEIHHRVKNNMQVIYSLLNLQAKNAADTSVRAMLEESRNRVSSMSMIHERLYRSEDLAHIDFREYLRSLLAGIADTYKRQSVVFDLDMDPLALDVNVGIPCGLIINELVSNCLKHAFPGGRDGLVKLGIRKNGAGSYVLFVADNGIGLPANLDFRSTTTLGLQLVNVLAGQIHGTLELSRDEGTQFNITFPMQGEQVKT